MWILDSNGDFLEGKRVWLRPGQSYLFGRVKQEGVRHVIKHNSISRQHMVITVSPVKPGDGSHIYTRSEVTVSDKGSKLGTKVDGEVLKGTSKKLAGTEHVVKPGKYSHVIRITWQPTVLSFSFSSKELKLKDPLAHVRTRLENLDIKTIIPYVVDQTTHVVQSKRNTAKGLQALVNGKWIVDESYVDALVYAATPSDLDDVLSLSPLEADFDTAWPDASLHLPAPGNEPAQRPPELFAPNSERINVFEGYTFVFGDVGQYESLSDPINNGHGKALLYQVEPRTTTAGEIVQFMENAAGQKGFGDERDDPGGVVLVRFRWKGSDERWSIELGNEVAIMTDQRVIEQREFLDAILANDATPLCRSLPPGPESSQSVPSSQPAPTPDEAERPLFDVRDEPSQASSQPLELPNQPSQPSIERSKTPRVRSFVSKMKTFDDGFDISSIPAHDPEEAPSPPAIDLEPLPEVPSPTQRDTTPATQPSRKASQQAFQQQDIEEGREEQGEDVMAGLLPGASPMKRRRAESGQRSRESPTSQPREEERKPKRQKLGVLEAARQHREAEEDAQRHQDQEDLKDTDIEKLKGLAIVEEMEMPTRQAPSTQDIPTDDRWDERWNGRKNFKKFRRKGEAHHTRNRVQTVIVPLEAVVRKEYGIGDHYWVSARDNPPAWGSRASSQRESQRDAQRRETQQRDNSSLRRDQDEEIGGMAEDDSAAEEEQGQVPESQSSRSVSRPQSRASRPESSRADSQTSTVRSQKRPREVRESDSDEGELRFRFRRRR